MKDIEIIKSSILLLKTTLEDIPPRNADLIVSVVVDLLETLSKEKKHE